MLFPRLTVSETQHNKIDISNLGEASTLHEQQDVDNEPPEKRFCLDSTLQGQSIPEMQQLLDASNVKVLTLKKKLKTLQQRTRRLKKKVTSLQQIVTKLRQNNLISSNCEENVKSDLFWSTISSDEKNVHQNIWKGIQIQFTTEVLCTYIAILFCQGIRVCQKDI